MAYKDENNPRVTVGGRDKLLVSDEDLLVALTDIKKQLKIMNLHLAVLSDNEFSKEELDE